MKKFLFDKYYIRFFIVMVSLFFPVVLWRIILMYNYFMHGMEYYMSKMEFSMPLVFFILVYFLIGVVRRVYLNPISICADKGKLLLNHWIFVQKIELLNIVSVEKLAEISGAFWFRRMHYSILIKEKSGKKYEYLLSQVAGSPDDVVDFVKVQAGLKS